MKEKMWLPVYFILSCNLVLISGYNSFRKSIETLGKKQYQVQHGLCSYTFLLPEMENCRSSSTSYVSNAVQRDAPLDYDDSVQRLQLLENILENNTQWLMKLENYIQDNMKKEMVEIQQNAVHNQTAVMLEIGTNLLNQTAEQTRKLTDVEAHVLNQTTRLELQLLAHSLSTNKLERQISDQTSEIGKLQEKNSFLEKKVLEMEDKHTLQLQSIKDEKETLQSLVSRQNAVIEELEKQLVTATANNSFLQKQQHDLRETVQNLFSMIATPNPSKNALVAGEEQLSFKDCAEAFKSGLTTSGIYTLTVPNTGEEKKTYCDMETSGGGWTIIQRRSDGTVDFDRTWTEYKEGFGNPSGEYWLGNELVSQLTNQKQYVLKIHLKDWEGNEAFSLYEHFYLANEELKYRLLVNHAVWLINHTEQSNNKPWILKVACSRKINYTAWLTSHPVENTLRSDNTIIHPGENELRSYKITNGGLAYCVNPYLGPKPVYLNGPNWKDRIYLKGLTGTAGKISSISQPGNGFSTKDADNDKCICKCSQMLTGGWWFDACGPSNLNGLYYPLRQNTNKFKGIKWYYWKGSGYSLKATAMMIRPADF